MRHPHVTVKNALQALAAQTDQKFTKVFEHGSLEIEIYKPENVDLQTPHTRDEVYIVVSGSGNFINGEERHAFGPGDFLFVPAGREHRFVDFTDDFVTWVIFYGPEGGERG